MKHQWFAYVVVALLSIGASVAIAGLPNNVPVDATIIVLTTEAPDEVTDSTQSTTIEPIPTTVAPTTQPTPPATNTVAPTTESESTIPDRDDITVIVANGSNVAGAALSNAERLRAAGYSDVALREGTEIFEFTVIYHADGLAEAAVRLAEDLDVLADFVAPLSEAPLVIDLPDETELLAYIGIDSV
jgi:hypothetical protein